ncbi:unnamed protein product [Rotaria sordida]|uniref:Uncharacterized protein n=1 Tax=Rotaria sordida TaxID=392033 RepID=A0A814UEH0_9BILA|nr:unnamed protein product [Rotaria sordida]CAF3860198.1 unnamed protein product [Rotaria sordida]
MSLNVNCLSDYSDIELIPLINNKSNNLIHPINNSYGNKLISKFSSLIIDLSYSSNDIELLLKSLTKNSLKMSTKIISSIIIYSMIIILILMILSIIFYIISYSNINQFKLSKKKFIKFSFKNLFLIILLFIYIFIFIQMIFILQHGNKTKNFFQKSIQIINQEFNSNFISDHFQYLFKQFDDYSKKSRFILIDGSKSLMIKSLNKLLNDYYYIDELNIYLNNINKYINEINIFIENDENLKNLFHKVIITYKYINNDLINLNKKLYKIQSFISLISTLFFTIIPIITFVPFTFIIIIIINYFSFYSNHQTKQFTNQKSKNDSQSKLDDLDVKQLLSLHIHNDDLQNYTTNTYRCVHNISTKKRKSKKIRTYHINRNGERTFSYSTDDINKNKSKNTRSHRLFLGSIRIAFGFIIVLLIILCIISGLLYGLDLLIQSSCRLVHYDQQFLISLIADNLIKSIDNIDVNATLNSIVNDCNNKIHFSKKFLKEFSNELNNELIPIIIYLNDNIYKQFLISIKTINISSEVNLLNNVASFLRIKYIQNRLILIHNDFNQIEKIFTQIIQFNSRLPIKFLNQTLNQFELFFEKVIESTIDSCPLPIDNIFKIDKLICHETANAINVLLYIYSKLKYFTRHHSIPGLSPKFFFDKMRQTGMITENESVANVHLKLKSKFGDVYQFWMGLSRFLTVCRVDDVEHIFTHRDIYNQGDVNINKVSLLFHDAFICTKGEKYKRHASVTLPLFRRNKIISNIDLIIDSTNKILLDK